ncbi:50S ribosomal protein L3 [Patescibacteria group bacterium]|nr:50S ribosomal protein L3 [Patescibacteria group bacterium]
MSKYIIGKKLEMSQIFGEDGKVTPVTKVLAGPCFVTYIKTNEKDGYQAVQLGYDNAKRISKSVKGHLKNLGPFKYLREFRISEEPKVKVGQELRASIFSKDDEVHVTGVSKGKGFQGVVRRWGFHGSPASHGHKDQLRMPGSIGATGEARVKKGKKMPGRMGADKITIKNLKVVDIDEKNNILFIKGAIPGPRKSLVLVYGPGEIVVKAKKEVTVDRVDTVDPSVNSGQSKGQIDKKVEVKSDVKPEVKEEKKVEAKKEESKSVEKETNKNDKK